MDKFYTKLQLNNQELTPQVTSTYSFNNQTFFCQDTPEFTDEMFWIFTGAEIAILGLATFGCIGGFVQFQKLSHSFRKPYDLDNLLSSITIVGAYIYAIFSMIAAGVHLESASPKSIAVFVQNTLLLVQVSCQGKLIV